MINENKQLLMLFAQKWSERYQGTKYHIVWGKHGAIIKRLLKTFEYSEIASAIEYYLTDYRDSYCVGARLPLELFSTNVSKVLVEAKAQQTSRSVTAPLTDYEKLEEARKAKAELRKLIGLK